MTTALKVIVHFKVENCGEIVSRKHLICWRWLFKGPQFGEQVFKSEQTDKFAASDSEAEMAAKIQQ